MRQRAKYGIPTPRGRRTYGVPYWYNADSGERTWERPPYAAEWAPEQVPTPDTGSVGVSPLPTAASSAAPSAHPSPSPSPTPITSTPSAAAASRSTATENRRSVARRKSMHPPTARTVDGAYSGAGTAGATSPLNAGSGSAASGRRSITAAAFPGGASALSPHGYAPDPEAHLRRAQPLKLRGPETMALSPGGMRSASGLPSGDDDGDFFDYETDVLAGMGAGEEGGSAEDNRSDGTPSRSASPSAGGTPASPTNPSAAVSQLSLAELVALPADAAHLFRGLVPAAYAGGGFAGLRDGIPRRCGGWRPVLPAGLGGSIAAARAAGVEAGRAFVPAQQLEPAVLLDLHARVLREYTKRFLTAAALSKLPLLKGLSAVDTKAVADACTLWACPSGVPVATQGDLQDCIYLVVQGSLQLTASNAALAAGAHPAFAAAAWRGTAAAGVSAASGLRYSDGDDAEVEDGGHWLDGVSTWADFEPKTRTATAGGAVAATAAPGQWFGAAGLITEHARFGWSAVTCGGVAAAGPAGGAAWDERTAAAIHTLSACCGGCHLIVLSRAALQVALGPGFLLERRRNVLCGVYGVPFAAAGESVWTGSHTAAAFAGVSSATTAMAHGRSGDGSSAAALAGRLAATASASVWLLACTGEALTALRYVLADVPYLSDLSPAGLEWFARCCVLVRKRPYAALVTEGAVADAVYVVVHGAVRVSEPAASHVSVSPWGLRSSRG